MKKRKKIIMAMSGGVDSSVATALLKRAGFKVIGVFLELADLPSFQEAKKRVKKIAKILGIPITTLNLKKEFKESIIDCFLKKYKAGLTPNPCVVCNKEIKIEFLLKKALVLGADWVATGHYARLRREIPNSKSQIPKFKLLRAKDKEKDQSYFLWQLSQKQLKHILFPLGNYTKSQVRNLAKKFRLPIYIKSESQEICFVPKEINKFLKKYLKTNPGKIVDIEGKIIGEHQGLWFYTIGQRKGLKLAGGPYYVLDKKLKENLLIVTKNEKDLLKKELIAKMMNWISGKEPKLPLKIKAKIRYRSKISPVTICKTPNSKYKIRFNQPQRAITPGQSVVFYSGEELLGGGIIC